MEFDDLADINADLQERLSSWRYMAGGTKSLPDAGSEPSINEAHVRSRQRHIAAMCLDTVRAHDEF